MRTSPRRKPISQAKFCRESRDREQGGSGAGMWVNTLAGPVSPPCSAESRHLCHLLFPPDSMSGYCTPAAQNGFNRPFRSSNKPMQKNPKQPGNNLLPDMQKGQGEHSGERRTTASGERKQGDNSVLFPSNRPRTPGPWSVW